MVKQIFVNLPVSDLPASKAFFSKLGYTYDERFTDEKAACMILGKNIFVMLLQRDFFQTFTKKPVADAKETTQVLLAIDAPDRDAVDELVDKAVEAGGSVYADAMDHGFMYQRSFADLDGHQWEVIYMNEEEYVKQMAASAQ